MAASEAVAPLAPWRHRGSRTVEWRQPVAAFSSSIRDRQMLEYTNADRGARLAMLVLHDDAKREYACSPARGLPPSKIGAFPQATCDQATRQGWAVISMKDDWKRSPSKLVATT